MTSEQSPVIPHIDRAIQMRKEIEAQKTVLAWGILNMSLAGMIYTEMAGELIISDCNMTCWPLWYIELAFGFLFSLNALFDFWLHFKHTAPTSLVLILLGLSNAAIQTTPPRELAAKKVPSSTPFPPIQGQTVLSYSPSRSPSPSIRFYVERVLGYNFVVRVMLSDSSSCAQSCPPNTIYKRVSSFRLLANESRYAKSIRPVDSSGLRSRYRIPPVRYNSAASKDDYITDLKTLKAFLHNEEKKQRLLLLHRIVSGN